jgi:uncharacterized membrane protein
MTPATQSAGPGTGLGYSVTVTNTDRTACPQTTFNLKPTLPSGWTGSVSPSLVTVAPGESVAATLSVTSPATAAAGSYALSATATDAANTAHAGTGNATYTVVVPCTRAAPTLSASPSRQGGSAGTQLSYSLSVTNKDRGSCTASTLTLGRILPSGWSGTISPSTVTLGPGQSAAAKLSVTAATTALPGTYEVAVQAVDGTTTGHTGSSAVLVDVVGGDTQAPTAPGSLTATVTSSQVSLGWAASTDNLGVTGYAVWRNGARIATTTTRGYVDTSVAARSKYTYYVTAFDAAGNASAASNTVTVRTRNR